MAQITRAILLARATAASLRGLRSSKASSHHHFRHPTRPGTVTIPHPKKDFAPGTLRSIARQSGVKLRG
jgi:hypothetical protein